MALISLTLLGFSEVSAAEQRTRIESEVSCREQAWFFTEERLLSTWSRLANRQARREEVSRHVNEALAEGKAWVVEFRTSDGRTISGLATGSPEKAREEAVIVLSGNISTSGQMYQRLSSIASRSNRDFYFLDYRGYGRSSDGHPSLAAFIQDQVEAERFLRARGHSAVHAYGPSLGGIVLLNAAAKGMRLESLVIDSVPSTLESFDCASEMDPSVVVYASCPKIAALSSKKDREVRPAEQSMLLDHVSSSVCGGKVHELSRAAHALNDRPGSEGDLERMEVLVNVLGGAWYD